MSDPLRFIRPTTVTDTGTFVRASTATYFDADGVMQTAGVNALRLTYDPANLAAGPRALVEPAATNLLTYSEQPWNPALWGVGTSLANFFTVTESTEVPDIYGGLSSVAKFVAGASPDELFLRKNSTWAAAAYAPSIFIWVPSQPGVTSWSMYCDFQDIELTATATFTTFDAWVAVHVPSVTTPATRAFCDFNIFRNGGTPPTGFTFYASGAQLEAGTTPTSYIPTTTTAVTRAADIITGSGLIQSSVPETDYPAWAAATNYTVGTKVIRTTTHKVYECLIAGINVTLPELATTGATPRWLDLGATRRWAMFDRKVGTATSAADSLTIVLTPGRINSLALLEINAATVSVDLSVAGESVYSASANLTNGNLIGDWYQYFYEPVYQQDSLVITNLVDATLMDLPAYSEGVLTITLSRPGGTVSCGVLVVGLYADLGLTQYSPTIGIIDYSRKDVDAFGNADILQRAYSKRMSVTALVKKEAVDQVARTLAQYRSTLLVWVGAGNLYTSMVMYGFYKDWEISIDTFAYSNLTLQVESVT